MTTPELARTRNGAKNMERTLEDAAAEIAQLRKELEHSRNGHHLIELALLQTEAKLAASEWRAMALEDFAKLVINDHVMPDDLIRAAALLEKS